MCRKHFSPTLVASKLWNLFAELEHKITPVSPQDQWLVALDIDGTIIHEDETLTDVVLRAVQKARDAGHLVTLSTGRSWETTRPILEKLELTPEYVVCANGAITMRRDTTVEGNYRRDLVETFDPGPVLSRIRAALPAGKFLVEDATGHRFYTEGMQEWNLTRATEVEFDELAKAPATRVVVVSPGQEPAEFLNVIESLGLHQVSYYIGWTAWLDIAPNGVNKGTAIERVRSILDIPMERVLVVGDGHNDIEMFEWASQGGRAIAMGQAPDVVKEAATEVTGSVLEDGLVAALATLPDSAHGGR